MIDRMKRRAWLLLGCCLVLDLLLGAAVYARWIDVPHRIVNSLLAATVIGAVLLFTIGSEPFRRLKLRQNIGREAPRLDWRIWLFLAAPLIPIVVLGHYLLGMPWSEALANVLGIIVYFTVFVPLGRLQRRGIAPYWRPAWYGFLVAGGLAGLVWAAVAGARAVDGLISGNIWAFMHYGYVRWAMRGAAEILPNQQPQRTGRPGGSISDGACAFGSAIGIQA